MAKLHFYYATMNSGKSTDLIRTVYNYEENNFKVLVLKPSVDTKGGKNIKSRIGIERKADYLINNTDNILDILKGKLTNIKAILVDEAQFLKPEHIDQLYMVTKAKDIPVICYGLRTNFKMKAFSGSDRLLEIADEMFELKTLCSCGKTAHFCGRLKDGVFEEDGKEIIIDGTTSYVHVPLCGKCYLEKVKQVNFKKIKEELDG